MSSKFESYCNVLESKVTDLIQNEMKKLINQQAILNGIDSSKPQDDIDDDIKQMVDFENLNQVKRGSDLLDDASVIGQLCQKMS